jgi:hypothetical protein
VDISNLIEITILQTNHVMFLLEYMHYSVATQQEPTCYCKSIAVNNYGKAKQRTNCPILNLAIGAAV